MNIDNIDKVVKLNETRKNLMNALSEISKMEEVVHEGGSINISEHIDGSGHFKVTPVYVEGYNHSELYKDLHDSIAKVYVKHLEVIEEKIKEL